MKKHLFLSRTFILLIISMIMGFQIVISQTIVFEENFDTQPYQVTPSGVPVWNIDTNLYTSPLNSFRNMVAYLDTSYLTTSTIDLTGMNFVLFEFNHICKIEFLDAAEIFISVDNGSTWTQLTANEYLGTPQFGILGNKFNSATYQDLWIPQTHTLAPTNAWWKNEQFDVSMLAGNQAGVKFQFRLRDGNNNGANGNAGWFLDDIKVLASPYELIPPVITLVPPIIQDTINSAGPFSIKAEITDLSGISEAYLFYRVNQINWDSIVMVNTTGDIFEGIIPGMPYNTLVEYYIKATDASLSYNVAQTEIFSFYTKKPPPLITLGTQVVLGGTSGISPYNYWWESRRVQFVYTASEIIAAGGVAAPIVSIAWDVASLNANNLVNYQIKMAHTSAIDASTHNTASLTTVKNPFTLTPGGVGWYTIPFDTPFQWNGTDNILVDVCWGVNPGYSSTGEIWFYNNVANQTRGVSSSSVNQCAVNTTTTRSGKPRTQLALDIPSTTFDAGVYAIEAPTSPVLTSQNEDVIIRIKNYGQQTLSSVQIDWEVNQVAQNSVEWTGSLLEDVISMPITLGSFVFNEGWNTIKVWTRLPNGEEDENNNNDTLQIMVYGCNELLSGNYTIDSSLPSGDGNFQSIQEAIMALNTCGLSGPVVFELEDLLYEQQFLFEQIIGSSEEYTITFKPGVGKDVVISSNSTTATIHLKNTQNIIFDGSNNGSQSRNLTIRNISTATNTAAIWIEGSGSGDVLSCEYITIKNCIIESGSNSVTSVFGIYIAGNTISTTGVGAKNNTITIENNEIRKSYFGIYARSVLANVNNNLKIQNNLIGSSDPSQYVTFRGIDIQGASAPLIYKNEIINIRLSTAANVAAIDIGQNVSNAIIAKNKIRGIRSTSTSGYGAYGINISSGTGVSDIEISNNFISDIVTARYSNSHTTWNPFGIRITGGTNIKVYYNSINMFGEPTAGSSASMSAAIIITASVTDLDIRNNIFANSMTGLSGSKSFAIHKATAVNFANINHNNYYVSGPFGIIGYSGSADVNNLEAWKAVTLQDVNSISVNPQFISNNDLHTFASALNGKATPIALVPDDIDDDPRDAEFPDIGADEFTPLAKDIGIVSIDIPHALCGLTSEEPITFTVKNNGNDTIYSFNGRYTINSNIPVSEEFTVLIPPDGLLQLTFELHANLSELITYNLLIEVELEEDTNPLNDTLSKIFSNGHNFLVSDYFMGFENTEPYHLWTVIDANNDGRTWQPGFNSTTYAKTGTNSARFFNGTTNPGNDYLFSRCFTMKAGEVYKISYWYRVESASYPQSVDLKFATDVTVPSIQSTLISMPSFNNTTYQQVVADFSVPEDGEYYFVWHAYSSAANFYAFIDDINITLLPPVDAALVSINTPHSGCGLTSDEIVTITVKNNGSDTILANSATVSYQIDGSTEIITEPITVDILPQQLMTYTFETTVDLTVGLADSTFVLTAWITAIDDAISANNTKSKSIKSLVVPEIPYVNDTTIYYGQSVTLHAVSPFSVIWYDIPEGGNVLSTSYSFTTPVLFDTTSYWVQATNSTSYHYTFNNNLQGWTSSDPCNLGFNWVWQSDGALGTAFIVNPSSVSASVLTSPILNISADTTYISFIHKYITENTYDEGYVVYSLDGGAWTTFMPTSGQYNSSSGTITQNPFGSCVSLSNQPNFTGNSNGYILSSGTINTSGANTLRIAFVFSSDAVIAAQGWWIDEVIIETMGCSSDIVELVVNVIATMTDAELHSVIEPEEDICSDGTEYITILIKNNGIETIDGGLQAGFKINDGEAIIEDVSIVIPAGEMIEYTFENPLFINLQENDSTIVLTVFVSHTEDTYLLNDTLAQQLTLKYTPNPPVVHNDTISYASTALLSAESNQHISWYASMFDTEAIATGETYETEILFQNTTFYVSASTSEGGLVTQIGDQDLTQAYVPCYGLFDYSWSAMLFLPTELNFSGYIDTIAFFVRNTPNNYVMQDQRVYMDIVDYQIFGSPAVPNMSEMTLVYQGNVTWNGSGWHKIPLQTPFHYDGNSTLKIVWGNYDGSWLTGYPNFRASSVSPNMVKYHYADNAMPTANGTYATSRANIQFIHEAHGCESEKVPVYAIVENIPQYDAGVISIDSPDSPANFDVKDISITLKNYGTETLNNVEIHWSVNGNLKPVYNWAGQLLSTETLSDIVIGTHVFSLGENLIKAWTHNPNGNQDLYAINDTAVKHIIAFEPLNGVYTIGGVNPDFVDFIAAIDAMIEYTIDGAVTFIVRPGIYSDRIIIPAIIGASDVNTITFVGEEGAEIIHAPVNSNDRAVVLLNGAKHVRFDSIVIRIPTTASFGFGFHMMNACYDIQITNSKIYLPDNLSSLAFSGIVASGTLTSATSTGNNVSLLLLENNYIYGGYTGISLLGNSANPLVNAQIKDNTVVKAYYYGMYFSNMNKPLISQNHINMRYEGTTSTSNYGMYCTNLLGSYRIAKNTIINPGQYGIYVISSSPTEQAFIVNNMIGGGFRNNTSALTSGIYITSSSNIGIYFNSILMNASAGAALYQTNTGTTLDIRNNSFAYTGQQNGYAMRIQSVAGLVHCNNNNYYSNGQKFVLYGTDVATLEALQLINNPANNDNNSRAGYPYYYSQYDLHAMTSQLFAGGVFIEAVPLDFDGEERNTENPCIGADEFVPAQFDIAVLTIISPTSGCGMTENETLIVEIANFGLEPIESCLITYSVNGGTNVTEEYTGTLLTGETTLFEFEQTIDMASNGMYQITVYAELTDDILSFNDTIQTVVSSGFDFTVSSYTMGFEPNEDLTGWFVVDANQDGRTWEIPYLSQTYSNSGLYSARFYNGSTNNGNDYLFSRCFDMKQGEIYNVSFWYRVESATYPQSIDLQFANAQQPDSVISTLLSLTGFTNTAYQQAFATVTVPEDGIYYFSWWAYSTAANWYAYIDDINISMVPQIDAAIVQVSPSGVYTLNESVPVEIKVQNKGTLELTSIPITYQLNQLEPVEYTWTGNLQFGEIVSITLPNVLIVSEMNTFCATVAVLGDVIPQNNSMCNTAFVLEAFEFFSDNVEITSLFTTTDTIWQLGKPEGEVIAYAKQGDHAWVTVLDGSYPSSVTTHLVSPALHFADISEAYLSFWHWVDAEPGFDGGRVMYSSDNGATWNNLGIINDPLGYNWYDSQVASIDSWSHSTNGWKLSYIKLSALNNMQTPVKLRFTFRSNASVNADGWAIDDIKIHIPRIALDAGVIDIIVPEDATITGGNNQVTVRIKNFGTETLNSIPLTYKLNTGLPPVYEIWTGALEADETTEFTFTTGFVGPLNNYSLCAFTSLDEDTYFFNDTTCTLLTPGQALKDGGVSEIIAPFEQTIIGQIVQLTIRVNNYGIETLSNVQVQYLINGAIQATEIVPGTILSGESKVYTFNSTFMSPEQEFELCAKTVIAGDAIQANDMICVTLIPFEVMTDAGVVEIVQPIANSQAGEYNEVIIRVKNFGLNELTNIPVQFLVDGNVMSSEIIAGTLLPGMETEFTFSSGFDSPSSQYILCAKTLYPEDENPANDEKCKNIHVGIDELSSTGFQVFQNIPNPAEDRTSIGLYLPRPGDITLTVTNLLGQVVHKEMMKYDLGLHHFIISIQDLSSGIYYYSVTFEQQTITHKMSKQ